MTDFDEERRFKTDPNNPDSDGDNVPDKTDIREYVFDPATGMPKLRNARWKGIDGRKELDPDNDGDGSSDGCEDSNSNGIYEPDLGETNNFDASDKTLCNINGTWEGYLTQSSKIYKFSLYLSQNGTDISGTSTIRYLEGDNYAVMSLSGYKSGSDIHLDEIEIIDGTNSGWCIKSMDLAFGLVNNSINVLQGPWSAPYCSPGNIELQFSTDDPVPVNGYWSGQLDQPGKTFPIELSLVQNGVNLSGTSTIRYDQYYGIMEVVGFAVGNKIRIEELRIVDQDPEPGFRWCIKYMELTYLSLIHI